MENVDEMDNVDEIAAYKDENGKFDVTMYLTQDGKPKKVAFINMHLSIEMTYGGSIKLVLES